MLMGQTRQKGVHDIHVMERELLLFPIDGVEAGTRVRFMGRLWWAWTKAVV